jgi:hypothetical protein
MSTHTEKYPGELQHLRDLLATLDRIERHRRDPVLTELLVDHYSDPRAVDAQLGWCDAGGQNTDTPCAGPVALRLVTGTGRELIGCITHCAQRLATTPGLRLDPMPGHENDAAEVWHRVHLAGARAWMTATDDDTTAAAVKAVVA